MFDDAEHLPDPVVDPADEVPDRRPVLAQGQLGGDGAFQAQLVLDPGGNDPVSLTEGAVGVDEELGDDEERQSLGSGPGAVGPGQHQVDDVLGGVVLAARDEPLDAFQVIGIALDLVGLGQHPPRRRIRHRVR